MAMKDLSGDGKVTMKDVLIGRGVIKKKKKKVKTTRTGLTNKIKNLVTSKKKKELAARKSLLAAKATILKGKNKPKSSKANVENNLTAKGKAQGKAALNRASVARSNSPQISDSDANANMMKRKMKKDPNYASDMSSQITKDYLKTLDKDSEEYKKTMKFVNRSGMRL